jgi:hypothetical protein
MITITCLMGVVVGAGSRAPVAAAAGPVAAKAARARPATPVTLASLVSRELMKALLRCPGAGGHPRRDLTAASRSQAAHGGMSGERRVTVR